VSNLQSDGADGAFVVQVDRTEKGTHIPCPQLYELHKLNQLQKLLCYEVLGCEQGIGMPPEQEATLTCPTSLAVAPLNAAAGGMDMSQEAWACQLAKEGHVSTAHMNGAEKPTHTSV